MKFKTHKIMKLVSLFGSAKFNAGWNRTGERLFHFNDKAMEIKEQIEKMIDEAIDNVDKN